MNQVFLFSLIRKSFVAYKIRVFFYLDQLLPWKTFCHKENIDSLIIKKSHLQPVFDEDLRV